VSWPVCRYYHGSRLEIRHDEPYEDLCSATVQRNMRVVMKQASAVWERTAGRTRTSGVSFHLAL
jgi:hypothetical protein